MTSRMRKIFKQTGNPPEAGPQKARQSRKELMGEIRSTWRQLAPQSVHDPVQIKDYKGRKYVVHSWGQMVRELKID